MLLSGCTYMSVVDEAMLGGDAVCLLWAPSDVDGPGVGVDLLAQRRPQPREQEQQEGPQQQQPHQAGALGGVLRAQSHGRPIEAAGCL